MVAHFEGLTQPPKVPTREILQDVPPSGGYSPVAYRRGIVSRKPNVWLVFGLGFGLTAWGWYDYCTRLYPKKMGLRDSHRDAQTVMGPLITAEKEQLDHIKRREYLAWEAYIMKGVPGWKVGDRNLQTRKWIPEYRAPDERYHDTRLPGEVDPEFRAYPIQSKYRYMLSIDPSSSASHTHEHKGHH
eukprot:TRINITY_DN1831_c0_g1::TRINITY_DN1831_c0_g1_i1::g.14027::m.14027 TRINITY_DN1831_c0_g1::TRINITY_DN1831_c0_g1_i1::g.14027  ORF type:complete len:200 (-),score=27.20,sp/O49313/NDADB_ARATH/32.09/1e-14,GRIM-19/PF06212.7/4.5e-24 TRINITY_DN1831_c0_g1_i1:519-1076(-)